MGSLDISLSCPPPGPTPNGHHPFPSDSLLKRNYSAFADPNSVQQLSGQPDFIQDLRDPEKVVPPLLGLKFTDAEVSMAFDEVAQEVDLDVVMEDIGLERAVLTEEGQRKDDLGQLMREKLYLQNRRAKKYNAGYMEMPRVEKKLLKDLLRDCDLTEKYKDERVLEEGVGEGMRIGLVRGRIRECVAMEKWGLDVMTSKGVLQIPGLLAVEDKLDWNLLQGSQIKKVKRGYVNKHGLMGNAYAMDVLRLPKISERFESIDFGNFSFENDHKSNKSKASSKKKDRKSKKDHVKTKKTEHQLIRTARMSNYGKKRIKVARNECFKTFKEIERKISDKRQKALVKISSLKEEELEFHKKKLVSKNWSAVCASVVKIQKFFQKDSEQNARKLGTLCGKERRKMLAKTKKNVKDYVLRAKKLNKEMIVYWKRRGKELNDLKKKREKIKFELKKKEEEKREQRKQKKKIEYLIKQSDIYAHIMAEKLGIQEKKKAHNVNQNNGLLSKEDVLRAENRINGIIQQNQKRVQKLQKEMDALYINNNIAPSASNNQENVNFDFSKIDLDDKSRLISTPSTFQGTLKEYQLKGLRWLNNLFEQGINGILADEMGLGKTVQAIALMTHVAENKNCWGPFLVIAPTITLFNWQNECSKFSPKLKILPYWGSKKDREVLRKSFRQKYFGKIDSSSHVVVTSYSFAVRDFKYLDRVKWQYVILDEAQAIKNIRSQRWSTLLSLKSRNKLLLTGTPIQNTMAELWALLHFIMPQLFDSHEEFQEWFSKDIEAHSKNKQGYLNKTQLNRLHAILKPFMLRRVKKDVEKEIGKKIVTELICDMSSRQKLLYNNIKKRICLSDLMQMYENKQKAQNLMNLVMQFRKVYIHI